MYAHRKSDENRNYRTEYEEENEYHKNPLNWLLCKIDKFNN